MDVENEENIGTITYEEVGNIIGGEWSLEKSLEWECGIAKFFHPGSKVN